MSATYTKRIGTARQLSLASFWFGISFLWGSFPAVVLPFILLPEHPGPGNPALVAALLLMVDAASFWWVVGAYCLLQFCMNVGQGAYQSERTGRRRILVAATVVGALGSALFLVAGSLTVVVLVAMLVGVAWGMLVSVDWAYMVDLAPTDRSGKFLGFSNVATAGSQAAAPFVLGPVIDAVNRSTGTGGYKVLFAAAAVFMLAGGAVLAQVRARVAPASGELVLASASD